MPGGTGSGRCGTVCMVVGRRDNIRTVVQSRVVLGDVSGGRVLVAVVVLVIVAVVVLHKMRDCVGSNGQFARSPC